MLTRDAIMAMTPDELNAEIWKALGWERKTISTKATHSTYVSSYFAHKNGAHKNTDLMSDYAHSIAAAWELEQEIIDNDGLQCINQHEYADKLNIVLYHTCRRGYAAQDIDKQHATAEQRARAWLIWKQEAEDASDPFLS